MTATAQWARRGIVDTMKREANIKAVDGTRIIRVSCKW